MALLCCIKSVLDGRYIMTVNLDDIPIKGAPHIGDDRTTPVHGIFTIIPEAIFINHRHQI